MSLTKEYLDKALKNLASKADVRGLATKKDLEKLATKVELAKQTNLLMAHTSDQVEGLARMVQAGFMDLQQRLDVEDRVKQLEKEMKELRQALQV